jgi:N-acetyl-anhydromuramyl-L-alanine amidase AmpD
MAHPLLHPEAWRKLMKHGNRGSDVAAWQATLLACQYDLTDPAGMFGDGTHNATMAFQKLRRLGIDGKVGRESKSNINTPPMDRPTGLDIRGLYQFDDCTENIPFRQAANYTHANRTEMKWVVVHSMEGAEASTKAETVSMWFAGENIRFPAPRASAHYAVDCDSIVQMVRDEDVAWHAPGANRYGIGIEHAGRARQTTEQWLDAFSRAMLMQSAWLVASICLRWNIPIVFVDRDGVSSGRRGITTHCEVTHAFRKSTHTDPGPNFPMEWYLTCVREAHMILSPGN